MQIIKKAENPKLFRSLRAMGYRKHTVYVTVTEATTITQSYWDGGSRTEYFLWGLHDKLVPTGVLDPSTWPNNPATEEYRTYYAPLIRGGVFRGKPASWHIYIHPERTKEYL